MPPPLQAAIRVLSGDVLAGRSFLLATGYYVIGRNPGTFIQLTAPTVSRRQVAISFDSTTTHNYLIRNLSEDSPALLNGVVLGDAPTLLANGDLITCGEVELEFIVPPPADAIAIGALRDTRQRLVNTRPIAHEPTQDRD